MPVFIITKRTNEEFQFNLHADNDEIILSSEGYASKDGCQNGIESVKENATNEEMYELLTSANDMYYFNLKSSNSQVIGTSEMYESESSRSEGIESVKNNAPEAGIDDQSYAEVSADEGETEMESVSEEESSESEN